MGFNSAFKGLRADRIQGMLDIIQSPIRLPAI